MSDTVGIPVTTYEQFALHGLKLTKIAYFLVGLWATEKMHPGHHSIPWGTADNNNETGAWRGHYSPAACSAFLLRKNGAVNRREC